MNSAPERLSQDPELGPALKLLASEQLEDARLAKVRTAVLTRAGRPHVSLVRTGMVAVAVVGAAVALSLMRTPTPSPHAPDVVVPAAAEPVLPSQDVAPQLIPNVALPAPRSKASVGVHQLPQVSMRVEEAPPPVAPVALAKRTTDMAQHIALLGQAEVAIQQGDFHLAAEKLDSLAQSPADSVLEWEAQLLKVEVLKGLGKPLEARDLALELAQTSHSKPERQALLRQAAELSLGLRDCLRAQEAMRLAQPPLSDPGWTLVREKLNSCIRP